MNKKSNTSLQSYENGAQGYGSFWGSPMQFTEVDRALLCKHLPPRSHILEVGCGPGNDSAYFIGQGHTVVATDWSEKMLALARERASNAEFLQMDMRELEFHDLEFDAIWSSFSFLHVSRNDAPKTLNGFHRVLKPAGVLYIAAHTSLETAYALRDISGLTSFAGNQLQAYVQEWRRQDLVEIIEAYRFRCEMVREFTRPGGLYPLIAIMARRV